MKPQLGVKITDRLRELSEMTISAWAKQHQVSRVTVHESCKGRGSRECRILIALELGRTPRELWPGRSADVMDLDDLRYLRAAAVRDAA